MVLGAINSNEIEFHNTMYSKTIELYTHSLIQQAKTQPGSTCDIFDNNYFSQWLFEFGVIRFV